MSRSLIPMVAMLPCCIIAPPVDSGDTGTATGDATDTPIVCVPLGEQPAYADAGTVIGRVTAPSGTVPVLSAVVEVEAEGASAWMLTNCGGGTFALQLPPGTHDLAVTKGRWSAHRSVDIRAGETTDLGNISLDMAAVSIAVVDGEYDDIGAMITEMGIPFDEYGRPRDLMDDPVVLAGYDVAFVNCGTLAAKGLDPYTQAQANNVRAWLEAGGTLYASDWEHELVELAVPEALSFANNPRVGEVSLVDATVLDRDILTILGKDEATIQFNLPDWAVIDGVGVAFALVEANTPHDGRVHPLAALAPVGTGKTIYTSFHNEQQITDDMEVLLYEMILSL